MDYPLVLSTKLLPIVYSHLSQLEHSIKTNQTNEQLIKSFLEVQSPHPATINRKAELQYLRSLSETLMPYLFSMSNFKCRAAYGIVRELLTNWVLLQITDIIAEPDIINLLVILATNQNSTTIKELSERSEVELLANFSEMNGTKVGGGSDQRVDGSFFNDQEKLYNFMQHLKSQNCGDVEILKFLLDVEHLNAELLNPNVITDPARLSSLQQTSERLLTLYQEKLYNGDGKCSLPNDLIQCYDHAKSHLEYKWKYDFYKSADYYKYVYGDREIYNTIKHERDEEKYSDMQPISNQKLSAKIKNAMSMKIAVDGIEEYQVYDAMDVANNSPLHYYNSMAVKLRKERGQDLDTFMQTFYQSIEQEADMGEDIAETQTKSERQQHSKIKLGNLELYRNLFNMGQALPSQLMVTLKTTPAQSLLYFLSKIVKLNDILLRIVIGTINFLPNSDNLVCMAIRRVTEKLINQAILAHLINELEEKLFDSKPQHRPTQEELLARRNLASERLDKLKSGLSANLLFLQNPILNKHLVYSLLDVLIVEGFNELNPNLMPK
jgi:hypothetical protein